MWTGTYLSHVILPGKMVSLLSKRVRRKLCIHFTVAACGILMRSLPGSGMGTLQQLLDKDTTLFDKMTAYQIYSFIQLVEASLFPLRDNGRT
jgi:hypothetical protein